MQTKYYLIIIIVCFILGQSTAYSQSQDTVVVRLKTCVGKESVKLRWMVENPHWWQKMNHRGFYIERYTDTRNGKMLPVREKKQLTDVPLKAAPLNDWEKLATSNAYAAVIAQALYGETFEVTGMDGGVAEIIRMSKEQEERYSLSLYAADMCFEAACLAGWGYEDKDVKPGECYLYRIIPAVNDSLPAEYGFEYACMDEYKELPVPLDLKAGFGDRNVSLTWNGRIMSHFYTSYQVEKSKDNDHFEPLSLPVTALGETSNGQITFLDTLAENNRTYYYRIRGISPFGEISQPSDTVQGQGKAILKFSPRIIRSAINHLGQAEIEWDFDAEGESLIDGFSLKRSSDGSDTYETVIAVIDKTRRSVVTDDVLPSNYFIITTESAGSTSSRSYPVLVMPVDSIPPSAPTGLQAEIDTLGIVRIRWTKNPEPDLLGYRVMRAYRMGDEATAIHTTPWESELYTDTVDLNNLNEFVCYQVIALDKRYNQSLPSIVLKVEKPLRTKPASPVLSKYRVTAEGIYLEWENNPDDWVNRHVLYRQHPDSILPVKVHEFIDRLQTSFTDSFPQSGICYRYTLKSVSRWGIESDPSPALSVTASPSGISDWIVHFQAKSDREKKQIQCNWKVLRPGQVSSFKIYRSSDSQPVSLWKILPGNATQVEDDSPLVGMRYRYLVYAVLPDGSLSKPKECAIAY